MKSGVGYTKGIRITRIGSRTQIARLSTATELYMANPYISLQPSEAVLVQAAATIYAGYLTAGRVDEGDENEWLKRSIQDAARIARITDDNVDADKELGSHRIEN